MSAWTYLKALGDHDLLHIWKILDKKFAFRGEYTYSVTLTKLVSLRQEPKETLYHFTKKFIGFC